MNDQNLALTNLSSISEIISQKPHESSTSTLFLSDNALTNNLNDTTLFSDSISDCFSNQTELSIRFNKLKKEGKSEQITHEIEQKELLHKNQLLELELSQQHLKYETLLAQYLTEKEDLMDDLRETKVKMQVLQNQYANIHTQQYNSEHLTQKKNNTTYLPSHGQNLLLDELRDKVHELETRDKEFRDFLASSHNSSSYLLSTEDYNILKQRKNTILSFQDQIKMIMFQATRSLQSEIIEYQEANERITNDCTRYNTEVSTLKQEIVLREKLEAELKSELTKTNEENQILQQKIKSDKFKVEHYNQYDHDRIALQNTLDVTLKLKVECESTLNSVTKESDIQLQKIAALKQSNSLLVQDKQYLSKQVNEFQSRIDYLQEKSQAYESELTHLRASKESLYQKSLNSNEAHKGEYEKKLITEFKIIRDETQDEIKYIRESTRNQHQIELLSMKESKEAAFLERDGILSNYKQLQQKYDNLLTKYRLNQQNCDANVVQLEQELRMVRFNLDKSQILQSELLQNVKQTQIENDKLKKKLDLSTQECYSKESEYTQCIATLEAKNSELSEKLAAYESLETDIDAAVLAAAHIEDNEESKHILTLLGDFDAALTSKNSRAVKQSASLARKVLKLEKTKLDLQQELDICKRKLKEMGYNQEALQKAIRLTKQPYSYLTELLLNKEVEMKESNDIVKTLNDKIEIMDKENKKLSYSRTALVQDVQRLIGMSEEIKHLKETLIAFKKNEPTPLKKQIGLNHEPIIFFN